MSDAVGVYVLERLAPPGPQCSLLRFSIAGTRAWSRDLNLCSMVADGTGVYVYGPTTGGATQLIKYSPDNAELWRSDLAKGEVGSGFVSLATDSSGVYLVTANAAIVVAVTEPAVIVRKYSVAGAVLWTRSLRALDLPERAAADTTGFYLLVEDLQVNATVLRKYDTAGNELWSHAIEPAPDPNLISLAVDGTAAYVAGRILAVLPRRFEDFGCSGIQSSRRADERTVEIVRMCASGAWMWLLRRASATANELVLEITEQSADGRRFDRLLTLEGTKARAESGSAPK